jgi:hypothetical protein
VPKTMKNTRPGVTPGKYPRILDRAWSAERFGVASSASFATFLCAERGEAIAVQPKMLIFWLMKRI